MRHDPGRTSIQPGTSGTDRDLVVKQRRWNGSVPVVALNAQRQPELRPERPPQAQPPPDRRSVRGEHDENAGDEIHHWPIVALQAAREALAGGPHNFSAYSTHSVMRYWVRFFASRFTRSSSAPSTGSITGWT
jgi:hypothetical protein